MDIGDFKLRGTVLTPTYAADDSGGSVCTWTEQDDVWCQLEAKGEYYQISMRHNTIIQKGYRIDVGGVVFEILQVTDDGNMQVLKCQKL